MLIRTLGLIAFQIVFFASTTFAQKTVRSFDWDNNIATLDTKVVIFNKKTGEAKDLTTAELALIRNQLEKPGPYEDYVFKIDFTPGAQNSFKYYGDGPNGENYFLEQIRETLAQHPPSEWQGPVWDEFVTAMSNPVTAREVTIITARGHAPQLMMEAFQYLQKKGYIRYLPELSNVYPVSFAKIGGEAGNPSSTKARIMLDLLDRLNAETMSEDSDFFTLDRDGKTLVKTHLWDYSDDDPKNILKAYERIAPEIERGRWPNIKITLTYTGEVRWLIPALRNVAGTQKNPTFVLQSDGKPRLAQKIEIADFAKREQLLRCESLMAPAQR